jgi:hypothetical protein
MITRIIKGGGFRGLLNYLASRDGAQLIGGTMAGETPRELAREFALVRRLRPGLADPVFHLPVRLPPGETLSTEQWNDVARRLLAGLGYADCPHAVFRHDDPHGQHIHVVASRITYLGNAVPDSNDYYTAMRIARSLERQLGLCVVPFHPIGRRPRAAELHATRRRGEPSVRRYLQTEITRAAQPPASLDRFLDRLAGRGIDLLPAVTSTGHLHGISYRAHGHTFPGNALGAAYTWPALERRLGGPAARRNLPLLLAARSHPPHPPRPPAAPAAPFAFAPAGAPPSAVPPNPGARPVDRPATTGARRHQEQRMTEPTVSPSPAPTTPAPPTGRTADLVRRHLDALGAPTYDVRILGPDHLPRHGRIAWSAEQIQHALPWLKAMNAQGHEILVRPTAPAGRALVHLSGVDPRRLGKTRRQGYQPAAAVRAQRGEREVWLRFPTPLTPAEHPIAGRALQDRLGGVLSPHDAAWGHLAGFTSPASQRALGLPRPPYVGLEAEAGRPFDRAAALAADARAQAATTAELRALDPGDIGNVGSAASVANVGRGGSVGGVGRVGNVGGVGHDASVASAGGLAGPGTAHTAQIQSDRATASLYQAADRYAGLPPAGRLAPAASRRAAEQAATAWSAARTAHAAALADLPHVTAATALALEQRLVATHRDLRRTQAAAAALTGDDSPAVLALHPDQLPDHVTRAAAARAAEADLIRPTTPGTPGAPGVPAAVPLHPATDPFAAAAPAAIAPTAAPPRHPLAAPPDRIEIGGPPLPLPDAAARRAQIEQQYLAATERLHALLDTATGAAARATPAVPAAAAAAPTPPDPPGLAAAFAAHAGALLGLESLEADLGRTLHAAAAAHDRLAAATDAAEHALEAAPRDAAALRRFETLIGQLTAADDHLLAVRAASETHESRRLRRDIDRGERQLELDPSPWRVTDYSRLHERAVELDHRALAAAYPGVLDRSPAAPVPPPQAAPTLGAATGHPAAPYSALNPIHEITARVEVQDAAYCLRGHATRANVLAVREAIESLHRIRLRIADLAARRELRAARGELLHVLRTVAASHSSAAARYLTNPAATPGIAPHLAVRLGASLDRYNRAETSFSQRHTVAAPPAAPALAGAGRHIQRLDALLAQVGRGDLTPETLARLRRETTLQQHILRGRLRAPAPPPPARTDLFATIATYRADRIALHRAARDLRRRPLAPPLPPRHRLAAVDRLAAAIGAYQRSAADLNRLSHAYAYGSGHLLPAAWFLRHPDFQGAPHRAAAAWAAHAARRGTAPADAAERLRRTVRRGTAVPRLLSRGFALNVATAAARWVAMATALAFREAAHER